MARASAKAVSGLKRTGQSVGLPRPLPSPETNVDGLDGVVRGVLDTSTLSAPASDLLEGLSSYRRLLMRWALVHNLVGSTDEAALDAHLHDCLAAAACWKDSLSTEHDHSSGQYTADLKGPMRIVDVGTGAGLPGIVLALAVPEVLVDLVEPNGKKTAFLQAAIGELRLFNVRVRQTRIESLTGLEILQTGAPTRSVSDHLPLGQSSHLQDAARVRRFYFSRAYASLTLFANGCGRSAHPGDVLVAMKSMTIDDELAEFKSEAVDWELLPPLRYRVPVSGIERQLVRSIRKQADA